MPNKENNLTLYTTTWCGFCHSLKNALDARGINYREIDVERSDEAAKLVESVNGGNRVVPTVEYWDATFATNPSLAAVEKKLAEAN